MLAFIKLLFVRWIMLRYLLGALGGLLALWPVAWLLKIIGIPLLIVLAIVGVPLIILLVAIGLPVLAVMAVGGMILGLLGLVLSVGMVVVKIGIFVVLPLLLVWGLYRWLMESGKKRGGEGTA